jgi:hypothetical protein
MILQPTKDIQNEQWFMERASSGEGVLPELLEPAQEFRCLSFIVAHAPPVSHRSRAE